jgi:catechol 2,3-dioxygenase-like lactoylglutathione lyase family enzyme
MKGLGRRQMWSGVFAGSVSGDGEPHEGGVMLSAAHFGFTVRNLERSVEFYQGILGLELLGVMEREGDDISRIVGMAHAHLRIAFLKFPNSDKAGSTLELIEYVSPRGNAIEPRPCNSGVGHLCFKVEDLSSVYAILSRKGVRFTSEPVEVASGMNKGARAVYLSDPDGIPLEMFQPAEASRQ